jgi:hypothetical protein
MARTKDAATRVEDATQPFVGQWRTLISTTNWEKGRIIHEWRAALLAGRAPAAACSDEAWSRRVGGVTGQHVGRLRRVWERFGEVHDRYQGLYWSHFHAALDWDDAEMWLEGAAQSDWSVSQMRRTRWETLGRAGSEPTDEDVVATEQDEDFAPDGPFDGERESPRGAADSADADDEAASGGVSPPRVIDVDDAEQVGDDEAAADSGRRRSVPLVRPFAELGELPADLAEAFEAFKLAVLRHKGEGWSEISRDDVLATLDALKELALAPTGGA